MMGRIPQPTALRRAEGNPGKRGYNRTEPMPPGDLPDCPAHLFDAARTEWERIAGPLQTIGVLTFVDRAALAAYCQCWGRWVEAEEKLAVSPPMLRTPSGHVQQSPWLSVANKQLELMARFMAELGITPSSRSRIAALSRDPVTPLTQVEFVTLHASDRASPPSLSAEPPGNTLIR